MDKFWSQFKSGTDIRGVASEGVEGQSVNLTNEVITDITKGFVKWLCDKTGKSSTELTVAVGRDSRISGPRIMEQVEKALMAGGVQVLNCGLASTPSMFMTTVDLKCDGAVQITASHHPFNRNGLKFFTVDGGLESEDITALLENAENKNFVDNCNGGTTKTVDYMSQYCKHLRDMICKGVNSKNYHKPLEGFKIVVDAGNGAGGFYADKVLAPLGADTTGSQFLEPDGMFPNHVPNPEDAVAMSFISKAVLDNKADLGVIFDTDVDRGGAVDSTGNEINRNRLVAVAAAIALENAKGGTIVTDSTTSAGLKTFIEEDLQGKHHRFKRGYKNVINEAIRLNKEGIDCPLAIETSGHAAMRENYFLDDGAYLCTKIIIKMAQLRSQGKDISSLTANLKEPVESREIRFKITDSDFRATGNRIIKELEEYAKTQPGWLLADDSREGVRVSFGENDGDGWFLLRLSVHDPIMPLNVESNKSGGIDIILDKLMAFLRNCSGLEVK
ncbi:phosphomannomutase/phosphoglucomutase [Oscillospiraceae bacterium LCP25S3_E10]|nr:phosphomannomutase/phosphoglucomutase [Ruminococcus sp.]MDY2857081.1 phosphomannomutase/phosphoglucomutase [Oscillospiraceae bacterium]